MKIKTKTTQIKEKNSSNLKYLLYFLMFVSVSITIALFFRIIFLIQKSTFNSTSYSVYVKSENPFVIVYEGEQNKLFLVSLSKGYSSKIKESVEFGIPIDGKIKTSYVTENNFPSMLLLADTILRQWGFSYSSMTFLDMIKLITKW